MQRWHAAGHKARKRHSRDFDSSNWTIRAINEDLERLVATKH